MSHSTKQRYDDVAVLFHWLIALLIIGLLAIGKYMVSLEENDPVRFELTQWHKSFGISVLALSILRLLWRFTHRPPAEPESIPGWQKMAASLAHTLLYALMFILPVTGWIMVSASPLNIDTILFNVVTLPHLPPFATMEGREAIAMSFHEYHELAGMALIVILLAHIGAALKHHLIDKDVVLVRMLPDWATRSFRTKLAALVAAIALSGAALMVYSNMGKSAALLAAGDSEVSFIADVTGEQTPGIFAETSVEAVLDEATPANSSIIARVQTASLSSENSQVEGSLPDAEWFDVSTFPEALFQSTRIEASADGTLLVTGTLAIKDIELQINFPMSLTVEEDKRVARGEFTINREAYNIGMESQNSDEYVGFEVIVKFRFDITSAAATE